MLGVTVPARCGAEVLQALESIDRTDPRRRRAGGTTFSFVITAVHLLIYSDDAPATRAFLRDVLGWPYIEDKGPEPGWLIFGSGPSEVGVHPTVSVWEGQEHRSPRQHAISLMCDDLEATMAELQSKGATFSSGPTDEGYGVVAMLEVPGADPIQLYQPRHELAYPLGSE